MIGKFWDALFDYADKAKQGGDMRKYEICHEIEDLLQKAYDDGLKSSNVIKKHKPKGKVEELVMSIPDIVVYKDKSDGQIWYELQCEFNDEYDTIRFDYPEEVIARIIDYRTNKLRASMGEEKRLLLMYIADRIEKVRSVRDVLEVNGNKKIITMEKQNELNK